MCRIEIGHASTCVVLLVQPYICQLCVDVICHLRTHQARGQQRIIIYIYNSCLDITCRIVWSLFHPLSVILFD